MTWGSGKHEWHDVPLRKEECDFHHLLDGLLGWHISTGPWNIIMACLIRYCRMKHVVEIGVWKGGTSALLADAVKDTGGSYVGVDTNVQDAVARIKHLGLECYCTFLEGDSSQVVYDEKPIDLLFIDAGHSQAEVTADWDRWTEWVRPGGTIFIDNTASELGVIEFLMELVVTESFKKDYQYVMFPESWGMAVIRKREASDLSVLEMLKEKRK